MKPKQIRKFVVGVVGIVTQNHKILALKRSKEKDSNPSVWECVAGKVELGEQPLNALRREISEECGLNVEVDKVPICTLQTKRKSDPMILIFYKCKYLSGNVILSKEHDKFAWLTPSEFGKRTIFRRMVELIRENI